MYKDGMTRTTSSLIVAVDGGGSRCRVRIADGTGAILGTAKGGPANISWDYEGARRSITETISRAYTNAGLSPAAAQNHVAALALAGAGNQGHVETLRAHLAFSRVIICSDLEATVHGALCGTDGTVASIGTGSFFFSQFEGRKRRVGGWGFRLSDECSGASLGQSVLRYVTRVYDGVQPTSPLVERIFDGFDRSIDKVVSFSLSATPRDYGSLVPDIVRAFDLGDQVAVRLLEEARDTFAGYWTPCKSSERVTSASLAGWAPSTGGSCQAPTGISMSTRSVTHWMESLGSRQTDWRRSVDEI